MIENSLRINMNTFTNFSKSAKDILKIVKTVSEVCYRFSLLCLETR